MIQEKRIRINPSVLESDMIDLFQDTLVSKSLEMIRKVLDPLHGTELDSNKSYVDEMHSVVFTEQYTLAQLEELGENWQEAQKERKTTLEGQVIADILTQAELLREQSDLEPANTDRVSITCGYVLDNPMFKSIFHEARLAGALPNYLHSLFLPNSRYRKTFVPSNADPFFMMASLVESRTYFANPTGKEGDQGGPASVSKAQTVWNLLLTTPIGSRLLCMIRQGLTSELKVEMIGNTIEGEAALPDPTGGLLLTDPKKEYKKFSDGETPLHPVFFPIFNKEANARPDGPLAFLFDPEKGSTAYNVSLKLLESRTADIWNLSDDVATARVLDSIKKGQKLRAGDVEPPEQPEFIFNAVKSDLPYYKTPEVLMETLMHHAFVPKQPDLIERVTNLCLTDEDRALLMRIAMGGDYLLGILAESGAIRRT